MQSVRKIVLTIVAASLWPIVQPVQAQTNLATQFTSTVAELRKIGLALQGYKQDHAGSLPARLTNLVSGAYLSASDLISCTDPSGGTEGGRPDAYPVHVIGDQLLETDEPGSSFFYEFSEAPISWYWQDFLQATLEQVDRDTNGIASWGEVKLFQLENGDASNGFQPYTAAFFPLVRCFWLQYPHAAAMSSNGVEITALNLGYDLQTVFASSLQWEIDQLGSPPSNPPELRDLQVSEWLTNNTVFARADGVVEVPLWPKATDLTNLCYTLLLPTAQGQERICGRISGNIFRWRPRRYSPPAAVFLVELSCDGIAATSKCYQVQVAGTEGLTITGLSCQTDPQNAVVSWSTITDATYRVDVATNLLGTWVTNVFNAPGIGATMHYTNDWTEYPSRFFRLRAEFEDL